MEKHRKHEKLTTLLCSLTAALSRLRVLVEVKKASDASTWVSRRTAVARELGIYLW